MVWLWVEPLDVFLKELMIFLPSPATLCICEASPLKLCWLLEVEGVCFLWGCLCALHFCCVVGRGVDPPDEEAGGLRMIADPLTGGEEPLGRLGFTEMCSMHILI